MYLYPIYLTCPLGNEFCVMRPHPEQGPLVPLSGRKRDPESVYRALKRSSIPRGPLAGVFKRCCFCRTPCNLLGSFYQKLWKIGKLIKFFVQNSAFGPVFVHFDKNNCPICVGPFSDTRNDSCILHITYYRLHLTYYVLYMTYYVLYIT